MGLTDPAGIGATGTEFHLEPFSTAKRMFALGVVYTLFLAAAFLYVMQPLSISLQQLR